MLIIICVFYSTQRGVTRYQNSIVVEPAAKPFTVQFEAFCDFRKETEQQVFFFTYVRFCLFVFLFSGEKNGAKSA